MLGLVASVWEGRGRGGCMEKGSKDLAGGVSLDVDGATEVTNKLRLEHGLREGVRPDLDALLRGLLLLLHGLLQGRAG